MSKLQIDYSTLDENEIKKLTPYTLGYKVGGLGSGCAGDPPGYPTYFLRSLYNNRGDTPKDHEYVIEYNKRYYLVPNFWKNSTSWDEYRNKRDSFMKRLYKPLPEDHPRVQAWIENTYRHLAHCYYDKNAEKRDDQTLIYPVPYYKLKSPRIDWLRWSVTYIMQYCKEIAEYNRMVKEYATNVAISDNHRAVIQVREVYPYHKADIAQIYNPSKVVTTWWEYLAEQPNKHNCPGDPDMGKHPMNKKWCQVCGWSPDREVNSLIAKQASRSIRKGA